MGEGKEKKKRKGPLFRCEKRRRVQPADSWGKGEKVVVAKGVGFEANFHGGEGKRRSSCREQKDEPLLSLNWGEGGKRLLLALITTGLKTPERGGKKKYYSFYHC